MRLASRQARGPGYHGYQAGQEPSRMLPPRNERAFKLGYVSTVWGSVTQSEASEAKALRLGHFFACILPAINCT